jgi:stearoyl-CoA desaturase (delta-9 desaturase)
MDSNNKITIEKNGQLMDQNYELDSECSDSTGSQTEEQISADFVVTGMEPALNASKRFKVFGFEYTQIKWTNVIWLIIIHGLTVWAYIHALVSPVKVWTLVFVSAIAALSGFGMSVGAHRLWAHRSFKARLPLRIFLALFQTMTVNGSCFSYARDHRTHHKWSETDADPKNPSRGFFFAHMGWWMLKKRPEVIKNGQKLNFDDLTNDWVCKYQHKLYLPLVVLMGFVVPTLIPFYCWNENLLTAFLICGCLRTVVVLHHLFTVNSVSHFWGDRPYNNQMKPTENRLVVYLSMGEGSHNYHHTFPMDYSSSEKKCWEFFNPATLFIDLNSCLGLAYDLKKPTKASIQQVIQRKGIPEYFLTDHDRSLCYRIFYGFTDWVFGLLFAMWPIWPILFFKLCTGQQVIIE